MPRHFDFGNDRHIAFGRVAHFILRIETAMRNAVTDVWIEVLLDHRLLPTAADTRQARVLPALDATSLVLGEVPVEGVQLVARHEVDVPLVERHRLEVAADGEMEAGPGESWCVDDGKGVQGGLGLEAWGLAFE